MKRKKGEGIIRERAPEKWTARITMNGKKFDFYGSSEKEVAKKLKDFKAKVAAGANNYSKVSHSDFLDEWLGRKKLELKPQSFHRLESTVELHLKPLLDFYFLDKVDASIIQDDIINVKSKELSYSPVKKIYDALNSSFKFAHSKGMISHNPVDLVLLLRQGSKTYTKKAKAAGDNLEIFTDDEIKRFVTAAMEQFSDGSFIYRNGKMFLFMLNTGLRMGDAYVKQKLKKSEKNSSPQKKAQHPSFLIGSALLI